VKTIPWNRSDVIEQIRERIWTHLSPTATSQNLALDASRLLQMPEQDVMALARVQFMMSPEVGEFLDDVPHRVRRLTTTTAHDEERSSERIRGAIQWPASITGQLSTGQPNLYVTRPARRAYQTPENALLAFTLNQVAETGRAIGWQGTKATAGTISTRAASAERWRSHRSIQQIDPTLPSQRELARIGHGRNRRRYAKTQSAFKVWQQLLRARDPNHLRSLIERRALVASDDPVLFEILCTFDVLDCLTSSGWQGDELRTFQGGLRRVLYQGDRKLTLWYQQVPHALSQGSLYRGIQQAHGLQAGALRPDLVLHLEDHGTGRWLLVECKLGETRTAEDSARASLSDLLAYRRAFEPALGNQARYGLGIAWGQGLEPSPHQEVMLSTQDQIATAINSFTAA
jgi:hypothetical protein